MSYYFSNSGSTAHKFKHSKLTWLWIQFDPYNNRSHKNPHISSSDDYPNNGT